MKLMDIVGLNVKWYRYQASLTQEKFAEIANFKMAYVSIVENGEANLTLNNIENVSIDYLYNTEAMKGTNKSLFDKMVELVDSSKYAEFQTGLISGLREGLTITYNKTAYQRLYK